MRSLMKRSEDPDVQVHRRSNRRISDFGDSCHYEERNWDRTRITNNYYGKGAQGSRRNPGATQGSGHAPPGQGNCTRCGYSDCPTLTGGDNTKCPVHTVNAEINAKSSTTTTRYAQSYYTQNRASARAEGYWRTEDRNGSCRPQLSATEDEANPFLEVKLQLGSEAGGNQKIHGRLRSTRGHHSGERISGIVPQWPEAAFQEEIGCCGQDIPSELRVSRSSHAVTWEELPRTSSCTLYPTAARICLDGGI